MLKIEMEFKKGIFFIRLEGLLTKSNVNKFINECVPVILKHGIRYVVINLDKVNAIDLKGLEALMEINDIVRENKGRTTLCSLTNKEVKEIIYEYDNNNSFFETSNELTALGVMKL